jgi:NAD(P)-dependent dehydrogenase (short-subunit alcohol dehydrogenase family)
MSLVTGATGHVGRTVVCRLASLGNDVAATVRDVQAASRRLPSGIALRDADYEDASALRRVLAGIDEAIVRQVRYHPCSIDKYLTWESASSRRSLALCLLHLARLNRRRSLRSGLQGLHCHYGPRTRELSRFSSSSNVRESELHSRLAVP